MKEAFTLPQKIDLVLVNPCARASMYGKLGSSYSGIEPPLWCALTAAFIREHGYSVRIVDAEAENLTPEETAARIQEYNPLLAGFVVLGSNPSASSTPKMTAAGEAASALQRKAPQIRKFFSGLHTSALPERTLKEEATDFVCQGEGFFTILHLLKVLKSEQVREYVSKSSLR